MLHSRTDVIQHTLTGIAEIQGTANNHLHPLQGRQHI